MGVFRLMGGGGGLILGGGDYSVLVLGFVMKGDTRILGVYTVVHISFACSLHLAMKLELPFC